MSVLLSPLSAVHHLFFFKSSITRKQQRDVKLYYLYVIARTHLLSIVKLDHELNDQNIARALLCWYQHCVSIYLFGSLGPDNDVFIYFGRISLINHSSQMSNMFMNEWLNRNEFRKNVMCVF